MFTDKTLQAEPVFGPNGELIEVSGVPTTDTSAKPLPTQAEIDKALADAPGPRPAARYMKTGGTPRAAEDTPWYKFRKRLADLDLKLKYPGLTLKEARKRASPMAPQSKVGRGRKAPPNPPAKPEPDE